jgi:hypothetical protein
MLDVPVPWSRILFPPFQLSLPGSSRTEAGASHPAALVYLVYFVVALREITRLRQKKIRVNYRNSRLPSSACR